MTAQEALADEAPGAAAPRAGDRPERWRWWRLGAAAVTGLAGAAAFPCYGVVPGEPLTSPGIWPLAVVCVAAFTHLVRGCRWRMTLLLGLVFGLVQGVVLYTGLRPIGDDAWIALSVLEALYFMPLAWAVKVVQRVPAWPVWTAALWVGEESVRGRFPFGGFPWNRLGFSQAASPFTGWVAVGGVPLLSFVVALAGGLVAAGALAAYRWRTATPDLRNGRRSLAAVAGALAGCLALGIVGMMIPRPDGGRTSTTVAAIQGNTPHPGMNFLGTQYQVLDNHADRTLWLAQQVSEHKLAKPDIVIWPEDSSDVDPYNDPVAAATIANAVRAVGVPTLIGAVIPIGDGEYSQNRGIVWSPATGPGQYYVKRHPLPFGEYVPIFRSLLRKYITRFDRVGEFVKGKNRGLLRLGSVPIGDVICFEVAYDGIVRDVASAPLLVVQTNNASFGRSSISPQQFAMARLRAVEFGRSVVVASTSGISGIIDPDGKVLAQSGQFVPDVMVKRVPLRTSRTLADRLGGVPELVLDLLGVAALGLAVAGMNKDRKARFADGQCQDVG
jgi:apolipoprotein N-acyltransferase